MGRASRWLSKLLRRKKPPLTVDGSQNAALGKKLGQNSEPGRDDLDVGDPGKRTIAMAAATAVVAEAAIAAARAAAEFVRLTSGGAGRGGFTEAAPVVEPDGGGAGGGAVVSAGGRKLSLEVTAAVKIQSAFRGYLARRALKALRGLVKLQALVRGYIVRKQSAELLRRMQAMVRVQARARANRVQSLDFAEYGSEYPSKYGLHSHNTRIDHPSILQGSIAASNMREPRMGEQAVSGVELLHYLKESSRGIQGWTRSNSNNLLDEENTDKMLEEDGWKPQLRTNRGRSRSNISSIDFHDHSFAASDSIAQYLASSLQEPTASPFCDIEVSSVRSLNMQSKACTAESSSQPLFVTSGRGPRRDEFSTNFSSGHPKGISNTESSGGQARCQSTPRQRPELEKRHLINKYNSSAYEDPTSYSRRGSDRDAIRMSKRQSGSGRCR